MSASDRSALTRRAFVRGAAVGAAGLVAVPASADEPAQKQPELSKPAAAQVQALFEGPGARFTEAEKKDVIRLLAAAEKTSGLLAAFPLVENSDPAVIFRAYRKEGK